MAIVVKDLPIVLNCESCSIFIAQKNLILSDSLQMQDLQLQKTILDGNNFEVINSAYDNMPDSKLKKLREAAVPNR